MNFFNTPSTHRCLFKTLYIFHLFHLSFNDRCHFRGVFGKLWWKNHTHVKKTGHKYEEGRANLKNFYLAFTDELEKQLIIKKTVEVSNKKCKNFNIYNVVLFFRKIKKNTWRYHFLHLWTKHLDDMIYSSWDTECDKQKLVIMGDFCPFTPTLLNTQKIRILKK